MRLYRGKIEPIADEVIRALASAGHVEVANEQEAKLDIEAVLKEYLRLDREVVEEAKNRMEIRGLGYGHLGKVRNQVAKERGAPAHDEVLPHLLNQILYILFHSGNIEEIYASDVDLRTSITPILHKHMDMETELDREVRSKIKNLEEGTSTFEVEYARVMQQLKRTKRLD